MNEYSCTLGKNSDREAKENEIKKNKLSLNINIVLTDLKK